MIHVKDHKQYDMFNPFEYLGPKRLAKSLRLARRRAKEKTEAFQRGLPLPRRGRGHHVRP